MRVSLIIDLVIVGLLLVSTVVGAVRGLVKTVLAVAVTVVALLGSVWLANLLAEPVSDWIGPKVQDAVREKLVEVIDRTVRPTVVPPMGTDEAALAQSPGVAGGQSFAENISMEELRQFLARQNFGDLALEAMERARETGKTALDCAVDSVIYSVVYGVLFMLLFSVLSFLLRIAVSPLNLLARAPIISTFNRLLGGAVGLVLGLVLTFALCALVQWLQVLPPDAAAQARIYQMFITVSPLDWLAKL